MEITEIVRRLSLFGIPRGDSHGVREILARLVSAESLSLGELQTARDIVVRTGCTNAAAYLFLAAMFISQRSGNAYLRPEKGVALLQSGGYLEAPENEAVSNETYCKSVQAAWDAAKTAAESLDGDVVVKKADAAGDCWFFQRNLAAVDAVSKDLAARAEMGNDDKALSDSELKAAIGFTGFKLNKQQVEAVRMVAV